MKKALSIVCIASLISLGGSLYWGYTEHQTVELYEQHLSGQYVNDFSQLAGYMNSNQGYLSVIIKNKKMAIEEQEFLVHGMYEVAYVVEDYKLLKDKLNGEEEIKTTIAGDAIYALRSMAPFIANLKTDVPLTKEELETLQVAYELMKGWNQNVVQHLPELNAEKETYDEFIEKYQEEGIEGDEWVKLLNSLDMHTIKVSKDKKIDDLSEYFFLNQTV